MASPIVDTLPGMMKGVNDSRNNEIRMLMEPFIDGVIDPLNIAMLGVTHLNKSLDHKTPVNKILGSVAYPNLSRSVFCTYRDVDDQSRKRRFMCHVKMNVGEERPTLAYAVESVELEIDGRTVATARVAFEPAAVLLTAHDILNSVKTGRSPGPEPVKETAMAAWIHDYLDGRDGWTPRNQMRDDAGKAGLIGKEDPKYRWTNIRRFDRGLERVPSLDAPRNGKKVLVEDMASTGDRYPKWHCKLVKSDVPY